MHAAPIIKAIATSSEDRTTTFLRKASGAEDAGKWGGTKTSDAIGQLRCAALAPRRDHTANRAARPVLGLSAAAQLTSRLLHWLMVYRAPPSALDSTQYPTAASKSGFAPFRGSTAMSFTDRHQGGLGGSPMQRLAAPVAG